MPKKSGLRVENCLNAIQVKEMLIKQISDFLKDQEFERTDLSRVLQLPMSRISNLYTCKAEKFSIDCLLDIMFHLGYQPEIKLIKIQRS